MMPLEPSHFVAYSLAVLTGFAFGFVLERAGFGDAKKLAAQFYLTDLRVLKVMFGAVVTAALGLALLRAVGVLDWDAVFVNPTFLGAQVVGGVIFGVGFVIGGHCPGTAVVSMVTGRINGLVFLVGVMLGALGYAGVYPELQAFANAGGERVTVDEWLGISFGATVLLVTLMAFAMFAGAEWIERRKPRGLPALAVPLPMFPRVLALSGLALAGVVVVLGDPAAAEAPSEPERAAAIERVTPMQLAAALRLGAQERVVWVQGRARHAITGETVLGVDELTDDALTASASPARGVAIAFADGVRAEKLARALAARGVPVQLLHGGLEAWDRAMDADPPAPSAGAPAASWDAYRRELALRQYFGGERAPRAAEVSVPRPVLAAPPAAAKKREGC